MIDLHQNNSSVSIVSQLGIQPRVDQIALQGQNADDALVDSSKRFVADEAFQAFEAEGEFSEGEGSLGSETSTSQPGEILFGGVVGAVDDTEVLSATAFHCGLHQPLLATHDEVQRFDNHPFAA